VIQKGFVLIYRIVEEKNVGAENLNRLVPYEEEDMMELVVLNDVSL